MGGSWLDGRHGPVGVDRSHRRPPMITDADRPAIVYASASGATAL